MERPSPMASQTQEAGRPLAAVWPGGRLPLLHHRAGARLPQPSPPSLPPSLHPRGACRLYNQPLLHTPSPRFRCRPWLQPTRCVCAMHLTRRHPPLPAAEFSSCPGLRPTWSWLGHLPPPLPHTLTCVVPLVLLSKVMHPCGEQAGPAIAAQPAPPPRWMPCPPF